MKEEDEIERSSNSKSLFGGMLLYYLIHHLTKIFLGFSCCCTTDLYSSRQSLLFL